MPLSFDTKTITVGELLSGSNIFRMPIFQRPFSWDEERVLELFGDIHQAMQRRGEPGHEDYFLGPIIIAKNGSSSSPLDVVDGQQRLVTLSAIFAILRDLLAQGPLQMELQDCLQRPARALRGLPEQPRLRLRQVDHDEYETWVQKPGGTLRLPEEGNTDASDRLLNAIQAIKSDIGRVDTRYVENIAKFILNNCNLVRVQAQNLDDAYVLFRSLNSRGLPLNELDIIRAELVGASYDPELAESIAQCWDTIQTEIDHEQFLVYVRTVISLVRPLAAGSDLREVLRELLRDPRSTVLFRQYLTGFLTSYVALDSGTLEFGVNSAEINRIVACLRGLPFDDWRTPALVWLAQRPTANASVQFFRALEGLSLALFVLGKTQLQRGRRFKDVTKEALDGTALTTRGALYLTNAETTKLRETLEGPIPARKKYLKHLLLRLNALMLHPDLPPHFPEDATLEHVLPQRPSVRSEWIRLYPEARARKALCELLGNYTLLTGKLNTSARNHEFNKKKQVIFALANVAMFPLTASLTPYDTWTERDIRQRHADMLRLLRQVLPI
jgi:hypothetical protein